MHQFISGEKFHNYTILNKIGEGSSSIVYEVAYQKKIYALKLFNLDRSTQVFSLEKFYKEIETISRIEHSSVPKIIEYGFELETPFILMELVAGVTLQKYLTTNNVDINFAMLIGVTISSVLSLAHKFGFIHGDLNTENILVCDSRSIKLIDFGLADEVEEESTLNVTEKFVGTIDFASPEQLGIVKGIKDERSDLYSLGIILYFVATGKMPRNIQSLQDSINDLLEDKIVAPNKANPNISPLFSDIILKLMKIKPIDRYQSAAGLLFDLKRLTNASLNNSKAEFTLGEGDFSISNVRKLFGREKEVDFLVKQNTFTLNGEGRGVLIEGEPGMGKSRVVREFLVRSREKKQVILRAKCGFQEQNYSLNLVKKLLNNLAEILKDSLKFDPQFYEILKYVSKDFETILYTLSPALKNQLGQSDRDDKSIKNLGLDIKSLITGLATFFSNLAEGINGLLIYIDDMQWSDDHSIQLFSNLFHEVNQKKIFIVFTARSDQKNKPIVDKLEQEINSLNFIRYEIKPLDREEATFLLENFFGGKEIQHVLKEKLIKNSSGNPFVLVQNIFNLFESGCLKIKKNEWCISEEDLNKINITDDIYEIILNRLKNLSEETLYIFQTMALIGVSLPIDKISKFSQTPLEKSKEAVSIGIKFDILDQNKIDQVSFVHDRIVEAILTMISEDRLIELSKNLINSIEHNLADLDNASLIQVRLIKNINISENPIYFLNILYRAGKYSNDSFSYLQGSEILKIGISSLEDQSVNIKFKADYLRESAISCAECGDVKTSLEYIDNSLQFSNSLLEISTSKFLRGNIFYQRGLVGEAYDELCEILTMWRKPMFESPILFTLISTLNMLKYFAVPKKSDLSSKDSNLLLNSIYDRLVTVGLALGLVRSVVSAVFGSYFTAVKLGPSYNLVRAKSYLSSFFVNIGFKRLAKKERDEAVSLAKNLKSMSALVLVNLYNANSKERAGDITGALDSLVKNKKDVQNHSNSSDHMVFWMNFSVLYLQLGKIQECFNIVDKFSPRSVQIGRPGSIYSVYLFEKLKKIFSGEKYSYLELKTEIDKKLDYFGPRYEFLQVFSIGTILINSYCNKITDEEVAAIATQLFVNKINHNQFPIFYFFLGLILLEKYNNEYENSSLKSSDFEKYFKSAISKMHFPVARPLVMVLEIGKLRIKRKTNTAINLTQSALKECEIIDSDFGIYFVSLESARLNIQLGNDLKVKKYIQLAYGLMQKNKWLGFNDKFVKEFGFFIQNEAVDSAIHSKDFEKTMHITRTLLKVSQLVSQVTDPKTQIKVSLDEVISIIKVERAFVFIYNKKNNTLEMAGGRDSLGNDLQLLEGYSTTIANKSFHSQKPILVVGNEQASEVGSQSAIIHGLKSIFATPLIFNGESIGILYVDSSISKMLINESLTELINAIAAQIAISIRSLQRHLEEKKLLEQSKDLEITTRVQSFLMPQPSEFQDRDLVLDGYCKSAVQCGGDWWWYKRTKNNLLYSIVCDITGHGAGPAMITAYISAFFDIETENDQAIDMNLLCQKLSLSLKKLTSGEFLMAACALKIDLTGDFLEAWNFGSPGLFCVNVNGEVLHLCEQGSLLGSSEFAPGYSKIPFFKDELVFLPSDGLTELKYNNNNLFGSRRVVRFLNTGYSNRQSVKEIKNAFITEIEKSIEMNTQEDDITMVFIKRN